MLKSCRYCGGVHRLGAVCPKKPQRTESNTRLKRFRSSRRWTDAAQAAKRRDCFLCRLCLTRGRITTEALQVHHITPLAEDWTRRLDPTNLVTLCAECHSKAESFTGSERAELRQLAASVVELQPPPTDPRPYLPKSSGDHGRPHQHTKSVK